MEKNIFEKAYFGKPYKTKGGKKVIYHHKRKEEHLLIMESKLCAFVYDDYGYYKSSNSSTLDIISEWQEEVNEKELDERAKKYADIYAVPNTFQYTTMEVSYKNGYKQGATDQRKIDIEKACYIYRKELVSIIDIFNKFGKELYYINKLGELISLEGNLEDFRKAMEEQL